MEENQVRENIEDYRFSFKKIFLLFKKDIFGGEKNVEKDKILEEVAKIKAQESPRIQELCQNLENHQTIVKKSRRNTTRTNLNRTSEIAKNKNRTKEQGINREIGE